MSWNKAGAGHPGGGTLRRKPTTVFVLLSLLLVLFVWQLNCQERNPLPDTITLYGFSALNEVMTEGILPSFQEHWKEQTGEKVEFITTFAGSGIITNNIINQFPADIAILASELDAFRLVQKGVVLGPTWKHLPHEGVFGKSPMVLLVRAGNPKMISGFHDLTREGVEIVHADPLTSGGGEWAILSVYGSTYMRTGDQDRAESELAAVWRNVVAEASSVRSARSSFMKGIGDALVTYEKEAITLLSSDRSSFEVVHPSITILGEHVIVPINRNIDPKEKERVDALIAFLWSDEAQKLLTQYGFRCMSDVWNEDNPAFGSVDTLFTLKDLGGPQSAKQRILETTWRDRILPTLAIEKLPDRNGADSSLQRAEHGDENGGRNPH